MKKVLGSTLALAVLLWAMTVPWQDPAMNVWWWRNQILLLTGLGAWAAKVVLVARATSYVASTTSKHRYWPKPPAMPKTKRLNWV